MSRYATPAIHAMAQRWMSIWQQSGHEPDQAVVAATTSCLAIVGAVDQEMIVQDRVVSDDPASSSMPNVGVRPEAERDRAAEFELLVRSLIEGLHNRLARDRA